jgi:UDP-N-acetylglucosamine:LPS N-acetylglucosamine transferase
MLVGDYYARGMEFRMKLTSSNTTHNVQVDALSITIDMPDTIKRATAVISSSGTNNGTEVVTYTAPFKATPTIGVTLQDADTGDYWTISSSNNAGFTITFYNSSNIATQKTFNWTSTGY